MGGRGEREGLEMVHEGLAVPYLLADMSILLQAVACGLGREVGSLGGGREGWDIQWWWSNVCSLTFPFIIQWWWWAGGGEGGRCFEQLLSRGSL